ncbi:MAG: hypothetical protein JRD89_02965 [Deltaproteobacteria bacterium]|nr:hypothetical protein [Deltaproteobacteria bacterium]
MTDWLSILKPKPVRTATYVVAASDASDLEVMVSAANATTGLVGTYYITG